MHVDRQSLITLVLFRTSLSAQGNVYITECQVECKSRLKKDGQKSTD